MLATFILHDKGAYPRFKCFSFERLLILDGSSWEQQERRKTENASIMLWENTRTRWGLCRRSIKSRPDHNSAYKDHPCIYVIPLGKCLSVYGIPPVNPTGHDMIMLRHKSP